MTEFPWASAVVVIPLVGALGCGVVSRRLAAAVGLAMSVATAAAAAALVWRVATSGVVVEPLGGWAAPLGIELYVDGFSAAMVAVTATVGILVSLFSVGYFGSGDEEGAGARSHYQGFFWSLWLVVWAAIHGVFVSSDLFNMYVCMEVMGLGSVALVALTGPLSWRAALRYLFVTLCGSLLYLVGVALVYGGWGMLDVRALAGVMEATMASEVALAVMVVGLSLKTALVPLHFWLPAAHANAPAPVSAVLSALVVKASFFILARLWLDVFAVVEIEVLAVVLAGLGAVAIVWGSIQALRQARLKMLVAYSTVAQVGYLFIAFAPAATAEGAGVAWHAVAYFIVAHACAKGAMFLSAGAIASAVGDDHLSAMQGAGSDLALPLFAFGVAGIGLMGLPPSGGYIAKWLFLSAAARADQPLIAAIVTLGGLLAALYVFKVVYYAFARRPNDGDSEPDEIQPVPIAMVAASFLLATIAVGLGLVSQPPLALLDVGLPFETQLPAGLEP